MSTTKEEVQTILNNLPDDCTIEDVQYHLYVMNKIQQGINRADTEGTISHHDIEEKFKQWTSM